MGAFFPMHISGLIGMPRRVKTYPSGMGFEIPNMISSVGAFALGIGFVVLLRDFPRRHTGVFATNVTNHLATLSVENNGENELPLPEFEHYGVSLSVLN